MSFKIYLITMKRKDFLKLLSRKLSGEISSLNLEKFERAIEANSEYKQLSDELSKNSQKREQNKATNQQLEKIWERISKTDQNSFKQQFDYNLPSKSISTYTYLLKVAAIMLFFLGWGIIGHQLLNRLSNTEFENLTTTDQKKFKTLDDGTKVWVNKKSSITFNKDFGKKKREVFLTGEAYFDVVKNNALPLFIHTGEIKIEVKGTAFNVKAYKENPDIQISLIRGAIQITDKSNTKIAAQAK